MERIIIKHWWLLPLLLSLSIIGLGLQGCSAVHGFPNTNPTCFLGETSSGIEIVRFASSSDPYSSFEILEQKVQGDTLFISYRARHSLSKKEDDIIDLKDETRIIALKSKAEKDYHYYRFEVGEGRGWESFMSRWYYLFPLEESATNI